jgi:hypothetical protein
LHPFLKAIMRGRMRAQLGLIQRLPLAARAQYVEDRISTAPIRDTWSSTPKAVRVHMLRQQGVHQRPQLIADAKPRRGAIIRGPLSFSFLGFLAIHNLLFYHVFGLFG